MLAVMLMGCSWSGALTFCLVPPVANQRRTPGGHRGTRTRRTAAARPIIKQAANDVHPEATSAEIRQTGLCAWKKLHLKTGLQQNKLVRSFDIGANCDGEKYRIIGKFVKQRILVTGSLSVCYPNF